MMTEKETGNAMTRDKCLQIVPAVRDKDRKAKAAAQCTELKHFKFLSLLPAECLLKVPALVTGKGKKSRKREAVWEHEPSLCSYLLTGRKRRSRTRSRDRKRRERSRSRSRKRSEERPALKALKCLGMWRYC